MAKWKQLIIIDGYNVLRNCKRYIDLAGRAPNFKDWDSEIYNKAREALFNDVVFLANENEKIIIVYDAANRKGNRQQPENIVQNIDVIFTDNNQSADSLIEKFAYKAKMQNINTKIITSDLQIQMSTASKNVSYMSAHEFNAIFDNANQYKTNIQTETSHFNKSIENRVDKNTARKLLELRDSL